MCVALCPLQSLKILVVEDNVDNQLLMEAILTHAGAAVEIANNGLEAIEKVISSTYDVIFMDANMPKCGGIEATRRLREKGCQTPIIALSAEDKLENSEKWVSAGLTAFQCKPANFDEIVNAVQQWTS